MARYAIRTAAKSNCRQKHGAVVFKGSQVFAAACNIDKNHPMILEESKVRMHSSMCAERRALRACADPKGAIIVVVRIRPNGETALSKPCDRCYAECMSAGIRKVIYS